ncbi:TPA: ATP-binding cassette domain-containing protein, partial [Streptococcus equi subsp. equi]|nr:ATP-binding cassette domain-containing protein [Streptococcus equi subsp. equi]
DSGSVTCFSNRDPIKAPKVGELLRREKIAYLFQNFALVEKMTVEENMMLAAKYNQEKNKKNLIEAALNKMGISDKLKSKVYELSGGEQQRVALARNMIKPFEIMLADEPTGSLDYENKKIVIDTLIRLNDEGKTIVVVSHDKDFEKVAHKNYI